MNWIFPVNVNKFKIHEWLANNEFIDFEQNRKVNVDDIVYLYCTLPEARIEYKMIVVGINIVFGDDIDDSDYSLSPDQTNENHKHSFFCRLKIIKRVDSNKLSLKTLRTMGCNSCFQSQQKVPDNLIDYLNTSFK